MARIGLRMAAKQALDCCYTDVAELG